MRRCIILILTLLITTASFAQKPWRELSTSQQRSVLASRRVGDAIRGVMQQDAEITKLDSTSRAQILERITSRTGNGHTAALYVYLYDLLRVPDGSMSRSDVRMLEQHTAHMLALWASDSDASSMASYAFALGLRRATQGKMVISGVLNKLGKKRFQSEYGELIAQFKDIIEAVALSADAGVRTFEDITPPAQAEDRFLLLDKETYEAATASIHPLVEPLPHAANDAERIAREECIAWCGAYHTPLKQHLGRNIALVRSTTQDQEYLTLIDANDLSYTVENELYLYSSHRFVVVERGNTPQTLLLGHITGRGSVEIIGRVYIDLGRELREIKCSSDALYLCVESSRGVEYLWLSLK